MLILFSVQNNRFDIFITFNLCVFVFCVHVYLYHMCAWCQHRSEGSIKCPSTVVVDNCEFPSGCWVPKPGPLLEQALQQSELCLQTLKKVD